MPILRTSSFVLEARCLIACSILIVAMSGNALGFPGEVLSHQKISDLEGGFTGALDDDDFFGISVDSIEDLDGDGVRDIAVGVQRDDDGGNGHGAVYILFLNTDGTVKSHQKISSMEGDFTGQLDDEDYFGGRIGFLGDLDRDGVGDLAVGARDDDDGGLDRGAVWILFLNTDGTVKSHQKISDTEGGFTGLLDDGDAFNQPGMLGDLDGDGVGDLAVSAIWDDDGGNDCGAVWILFLNTDGTVKSHQKISKTEGGFTGDVDPGDWFGNHPRPLGDLDGDGVIDLAVGACRDEDGGWLHGAVWILFLNTDGTVKSHQKISDSEGDFTGVLVDQDQFGSSLAPLGDLNCDGTTDLAVGATSNPPAGEFEPGAAWLLFLNSDGTVKSHHEIGHREGGFTGDLHDDDLFGCGVTALGDLDGDGLGDLAVGAYLDDDGGDARGAVWILFQDGLHLGLASPSGGEEWPVGSIRTVSWCGLGLVDLHLSVDGGRTFDLLRSGLTGNSFGLRVPHAPSRFSLIRVTQQATPYATADSDSFFTISSDVSLLAFKAARSPENQSGAILSWATKPGPEDLAGYRLEKCNSGDEWRTEIALTSETSYEDPAVGAGARYRLFSVNGWGGEISLGETMLLRSASLSAWPLPHCNGPLTVSFATASDVGGGDGRAEVGLFDATGRLVRWLVRGSYPAGIHSATWDGLDERGEPAPTGIYLLRAASGGHREAMRVVVIR
ncbi:FlgD immunoglobulin-like domain containing protein [Candidatus Eisenbacteria bacterium]|uniref:FlgD immunoglobulin-like domain containing protein n=1 Tax=Eiseniibacteriota bacterium TaxID=2212470 RepID=A0ABV6YL56_UNCEI